MVECGVFWSLVADIWAIVNIVQSSVPTNQKIPRVVIVALLPVVGVVLWFLLGPVPLVIPLRPDSRAFVPRTGGIAPLEQRRLGT